MIGPPTVRALDRVWHRRRTSRILSLDLLGYGKRALVALMLLTAATACGDDDELDRNQVAGELGNGDFRYECVEDSDPICVGSRSAREFGERIGVDGVFDVSFDVDPDAYDDESRIEVTSGVQSIVQDQGQRFRARSPGTVPLLAKRTKDSRVVDILHLEVATIDDLELLSNGSSPRVIWTTGSTELLTVEPVDSLGSVLAGARDYEWSTSDADVIRLERSNPTAEMELRALSPGTAVITVVTGDVATTLEITAEGEPVRPDAGPPPAVDGGARVDAGVEAGTDASGDGPERDAGTDANDSGSDADADATVPDASGDAAGDGASDGGTG